MIILIKFDLILQQKVVQRVTKLNYFELLKNIEREIKKRNKKTQ